MSPPYWGKYVFHDNNRDAHQKALKLTHAVPPRLFYDYHPTVVHDLHESIPLLHTWNGTGPYNVNLDPIVDQRMARDLRSTRSRRPDVARDARCLDVGLRRGVGPALPRLGGHRTTTRSAAATRPSATPRRRRSSARCARSQQVRGPAGDRAASGTAPCRRPRSSCWSLRDNTNYMETGVPLDPRLDRQQREGDAAQLLPQGLQLLAEGREGQALRVRHSGEPGRPAARGADDRGPARPPHRGVSRSTAPVTREGGDVPEGQLRREARPALPQLRRGPARAAEVPDRDAVPAVRRRLVGAAGALRPRGQAHRRREDRVGRRSSP